MGVKYEITTALDYGAASLAAAAAAAAVAGGSMSRGGAGADSASSLLLYQVRVGHVCMLRTTQKEVCRFVCMCMKE